jgi:hypothetical protein
MVDEPARILSELRDARASLSAVASALQMPGLDAWVQAAPRLQHAAGLLKSAERSLLTAGAVPLNLRAEIKANLQALFREIRRVDALMRAAADFYAGWAQLVGAALGGYTPAGTIAPAAAAPRLTVRG